MKRLLVIIALTLITMYGCGSSSETADDTDSDVKDNTSSQNTSDESAAQGLKIINIAKSEQGNEMYSPEVDSTYLYWLNDQLIVLNGSTKCNIFALNVLYKSGFKTPLENALSRDLFDTTNFTDILPVVGYNEIDNAKTGDLIIWMGHVIIFESFVSSNGVDYAKGYWAGTRQPDNGDNIKNNVCYGKYRLDRDFVVRRPVRKLSWD